MAGPTLRIEAPARKERAGGITQVAEFVQNDRIGNAEAVVYQSDNCTFPYTEEVRCFAAAAVPDKTYAGIEIEDAIGAPFTLVAGVSCFINPDPDEEARARAIFDAGKDRALEEIVGVWADGGVALAAGTSVEGAIALVDQELDDKYIGQGVILMSRADAVLADAAGAISVEDGDAYPTTVNGTPILASGRIASGTVYGVGAIKVEHTGTQNYNTHDLESNLHYALAEAIFVLAVDCEFRIKSSTGA